MYDALETATPRFFQVGQAISPSWPVEKDVREETIGIEWRIASIVRDTGEFNIYAQQIRRFKTGEDGKDIGHETISGKRLWAEVPTDMVATLFRSN